MPFKVPTLQQVNDRLAQSHAVRLGLSAASVRRTNIGEFAKDSGGAIFTLHDFQRNLAAQLIYDTADTDLLERWAGIWGITRKPPSKATGTVDFTGTDSTSIAAGTVLSRADGVEYVTDTAVIIAGGTASVAVTAQATGAAGNADAGDPLDFVSPVAGADSVALVAAGGIVAGSDAESDDALLERFLARIRVPPHGGAAHDYIAWVLECPDVDATRVWVYPGELGLGTVTVRFVMDNKAGTIIPDAGEIAIVQAWLDERRPVTAAVTVVAPIPVALDPEISISPNSAAVQAAITAELEDMLARDAEPGGTLLISRIGEAISIAEGEFDHAVVSPAGDVVHGTGEIPVLGTVVWNAL